MNHEDPLLSSEEFAFGGPLFGRAFDPSEITGDDGFAVRLELRFTSQPGIDNPNAVLRQVQPYVNWDWGRVFNKETDGSHSHRSAASFGMGVRANLGRDTEALLELDWPTIGSVAARGNDGGDVRLFFSWVSGF